MKSSVKKILKETYEKQFLSNICNKLSTGNNHESIEYMVNTIRELRNMELLPETKNRLEVIFKKWERDIKENDKDRPKVGALRGATADSQSDISNFYLSAIQDVLCPMFMEMD
jgi:hypothetical protein